MENYSIFKRKRNFKRKFLNKIKNVLGNNAYKIIEGGRRKS